MTARPGLIRAALADTFCICAIFLISAVPLFAEEVEPVEQPYELREYYQDGASVTLQTLPGLDMCLDASLDAAAEVPAGALAWFGCLPV